MNAKISVCVICGETIMHLFNAFVMHNHALYNLHDCIFKSKKLVHAK